MIRRIDTRLFTGRMVLICDVDGCPSRFVPRGSADSAPGGAGVELRRRAERAGWKCEHPLMSGPAGYGSDRCPRHANETSFVGKTRVPGVKEEPATVAADTNFYAIMVGQRYLRFEWDISEELAVLLTRHQSKALRFDDREKAVATARQIAEDLRTNARVGGGPPKDVAVWRVIINQVWFKEGTEP